MLETILTAETEYENLVDGKEVKGIVKRYELRINGSVLLYCEQSKEGDEIWNSTNGDNNLSWKQNFDLLFEAYEALKQPGDNPEIIYRLRDEDEDSLGIGHANLGEFDRKKFRKEGKDMWMRLDGIRGLIDVFFFPNWGIDKMTNFGAMSTHNIASQIAPYVLRGNPLEDKVTVEEVKEALGKLHSQYPALPDYVHQPAQ